MIYPMEIVQKQTMIMLIERLEAAEKKLEAIEKKLDNVRRGLFARNAENERKYRTLSYEFEEVKTAICKNTQSSEEKIVKLNAAC